MNHFNTPLNPGIAQTVQFLRNRGFVTTDSGDGQTHDFECDSSIPYIHMRIDTERDNLVSEAKRLLWILKCSGVNVTSQNEKGTAPAIELTYNPAEPFAVLTLYNVTDSSFPNGF